MRCTLLSPLQSSIPTEPGCTPVLAPADGRVVVVEKARDPYLDRDALKISVFMNVFNVHSNRSPIDGKVVGVWYHAGSFLNAALDKASLENERNALHLRRGDGRDVTRRWGTRSRADSATGSSA